MNFSFNSIGSKKKKKNIYIYIFPAWALHCTCVHHVHSENIKQDGAPQNESGKTNPNYDHSLRKEKLHSCTWQPFEVSVHFIDTWNALNVTTVFVFWACPSFIRLFNVYEPCGPQIAPNPLTSTQSGTWASTWLAYVSALCLHGRSPLPEQVLVVAPARLSSSLCSCLWWWSLARSSRAGSPWVGSGWRHVGIWPAGWSPFWLSLSYWGPRTTRDQSCGSCGLLRRKCCNCSPGNVPWTYSRRWTFPTKEGKYTELTGVFLWLAPSGTWALLQCFRSDSEIICD